MSAPNQDYSVNAGEMFLRTFRYATTPLIAKAITGIQQAASPTITATGHGLVDGWPAAVVSAKGMTQINSANYPPRAADWHQATFVDANTVQFNDVNSADYGAYTSGGYLIYPTPVSLIGMTAVFNVFDNPNHTGTPLVALTSGSGVTLTDGTKTIVVKFPTVGVTWTAGYYELIVTDAASIPRELVNGIISILP